MTNGCTPSLLNNALTSEEYLKHKFQQNPFQISKNQTQPTTQDTKISIKKLQLRLREKDLNPRAPSFGVNNNWALSHRLLHALLEPRPERGSHSLNRNGPVCSWAIGAKVWAWAGSEAVSVVERNRTKRGLGDWRESARRIYKERGETGEVRCDCHCVVFGPSTAFLELQLFPCHFTLRLTRVCLPFYLGFSRCLGVYLLFGLLPICCWYSRDMSTKHIRLMIFSILLY